MSESSVRAGLQKRLELRRKERDDTRKAIHDRLAALIIADFERDLQKRMDVDRALVPILQYCMQNFNVHGHRVRPLLHLAGLLEQSIADVDNLQERIREEELREIRESIEADTMNATPSYIHDERNKP